MSTADDRSFEERSSSMEDNLKLSKTDEENINVSLISVHSDVFHNTMKADTDVVESGQNEKYSENENSMDLGLADLERTGTLKPPIQSNTAAAAGTELSVQTSDGSSTQIKSEETRSEGSSNEASDLRTRCLAQLETESSHNGPRLSVHLDVVDETVRDDTSASVTSVGLRKSRACRKKTKCRTDECEVVSQAMLVRSDELHNVTNSISASRTEIKPHAVQEATKRPVGRSNIDSPVSLTSDGTRELIDDGTKALSCGENVHSRISVRPSVCTVISQHSGDVDDDVSALGTRTSVDSVSSDLSSNSSSVIISKPPKPSTVNKAVNDAQTVAETKSTTGDLFSVSSCLYCCFTIMYFICLYICIS